MTASLLDRLLDDSDDTKAPSLRDVHASIRRDLDALLNARQPWASLPPRFSKLRDSLLGFGLSDFAAGAFNSMAQRDALCQEIAGAIRRFEPRLGQVKVKLRDRAETMSPLLRIRIEAVLQVDGFAEPIGFNSELDATTADMTVRPPSNG